MSRYPLRVAAALLVVGALSLATPLVASAGTGATSPAQRQYHQALSAYDQARASIQRTFRAAVHAARKALHNALAIATTSAERSAAQQIYETAIINAAAVRSNALVALGNPPARPSKSHHLSLRSGASLPI